MYNIGIDNLDESLTRLISETGNAIASLVVKTDANSASIEALAQWKDGTGTDSLAGFVANATKDFATVSMLAQYTTTSEVNGLISDAKAGIIADARDGMATISMLASYTTTSDVNGLISSAKAGIISEAQDGMATVSMISSVTNSAGKVTAASIVAAVNEAGSSVKIDADHVDISGFVTFSDLSQSGQSTVNGNNISLISDKYGVSQSSLNFVKQNGSYGDEDFFKIKTIENDTETEDQSMFAAVLETYSAKYNNTRYQTALKLIADGSISLEAAAGRIYMASQDYMTIDARGNLGVRARLSGSGMDTMTSSTYYFCTDGIYYGTKKVLSV
nr:MAG TPA_asm: hypothetical protein [Caudoviricetes sp.]